MCVCLSLYWKVTCELNMEQVAVRRRNMPLEKQRRGDLYALHDIQHPDTI